MIQKIGAFVLTGCLWFAAAQGNGNGNGPDGNDNGNAYGPIHETLNAHTFAGSAGTTIPITYHGGPVMLGTVNVYYIWYGSWTGNSAKTILANLGSSIGGSPYFNINKTYSSSAGSPTGLVHLAGQIDDNYSYGKNLSDNAIGNVVALAINSGRLPKDENGVYFVLTSKDVTAVSGFCSRYCGWHTYGTLSGTKIKYSFVGNPERCPNACSAQSVTPNGNLGADGMASIIAHELEEAVTDPQLNAWYDSNGYENADKCAWTFGATTTLPGGAKYNVTLGSMNYLIQQNWVKAATQYCAMQ
jgi:hypothetical protein